MADLGFGLCCCKKKTCPAVFSKCQYWGRDVSQGLLTGFRPSSQNSWDKQWNGVVDLPDRDIVINSDTRATLLDNRGSNLGVPHVLNLEIPTPLRTTKKCSITFKLDEVPTGPQSDGSDPGLTAAVSIKPQGEFRLLGLRFRDQVGNPTVTRKMTIETFPIIERQFEWSDTYRIDLTHVVCPLTNEPDSEGDLVAHYQLELFVNDVSFYVDDYNQKVDAVLNPVLGYSCGVSVTFSNFLAGDDANPIFSNLNWETERYAETLVPYVLQSNIDEVINTQNTIQLIDSLDSFDFLADCPAHATATLTTVVDGWYEVVARVAGAAAFRMFTPVEYTRPESETRSAGGLPGNETREGYLALRFQATDTTSLVNFAFEGNGSTTITIEHVRFVGLNCA